MRAVFRSIAPLSLAAALLCFAPAVQAQTHTTNVTVASLYASGAGGPGVPMPYGTVCGYAAGPSGAAISVTESGWGLVPAGTQFCGNVVTGAISGGINVPDANHSYSAAPFNYNFTIQQTDASGDNIGLPVTIKGVPNVTGSTFALDSYTPVVSVPVSAPVIGYGSSVPSSCTSPSIWVTTGGAAYFCASGTYSALSPGPTGPAGPPGPTGSGTAAVGPAGCTQISNGTNVACSDNTTVVNTLPVQEYLNTAHPPLAYWDAALHNCTNQKVRILAPDDSRWIATTTVIPGSSSNIAATFPNRIAARLAQHLQALCGNGGTGFQALVPVWNTGSLNLDFFAGATGTWTTDASIGPYQNSGSGNIGTTVLTTSAMTIPFVTSVAYDHLNMLCASGPGLHAWTLNVDSNPVGSCGGTAGSLTAVLGTSSAVTLGSHTASIVCGTSPCEGYAVEGAAGTTGGVVDNLSIGSCAMECFGLAPSTQMAFADLIPGNDQLVILSMIANEPGIGYSTTSFQTALNSVISHEHGLSYPPSVLIYAPLQDGIGGQASYYPILKATALAQNAAYFDMRDRWGSSLISWLFGPDTDHENNIGDGETEAAIAQTIFDTFPSSGSIPTTTCGAGYSLVSFGPSGGTCALNNASTTACGTGYAHHAGISVASSSVSGGADLTNFPVLFGFNGATTNSITLTNLKTVANSGQVQSSSGLDVIFCSAATSGVQLAHELVAGSYSATTGAGEWYVSIPDLSHTATTTVYAFWGNSSAADTSNAPAVWSNGYAAVYHGGTASSVALTDSTGNGNTLTNSGATAAAGQFGGGFSVTPSTYLASASATGASSGSSPRTVEGWANFSSGISGDNVAFSYGSVAGGSPTFFAPDYSLGGPYIYVGEGSDPYGFSGSTMSTGAWHYIAGVLPSGSTTVNSMLVYVDGTLAPSPSCISGSCTETIATTASTITINGVPGTSIARTTAVVDEVRISNVGRSAGWVATQYANQSNPSTFLTVGTIF